MPPTFSQTLRSQWIPARPPCDSARAARISRLQLPADERLCRRVRLRPEESSFFTSVGHSFPAVCIRTSTERPEALDKGCFIIAGIDEKSLLQAVDTAVEMTRNADNGIPVPVYTDENVSTKVVKIIQSYTGIVNKMVWRKF